MTAGILILGGTAEARALAEALHPSHRVTTSLAGATKTPRPLPGAIRTGGFGGAHGLARYLAENRIEFLVDATHPYAARMGRNAAAAAETAGVPFLRLERPPWDKTDGDSWTEFASTEALATGLSRLGKRAFVTLGGADLDAFANLPDIHLVLRAIDRPEPMPAFIVFDLILSAGPFDFENEVALLSDRRIDVVVSRNAGGTATYPKIAAARHLSIPVAMLARPSRPSVATVGTAEEAARRIVKVLSS